MVRDFSVTSVGVFIDLTISCNQGITHYLPTPNSRQKRCATRRSLCYGRKVSSPTTNIPSRRWVTTSVRTTISPPPQSWQPPLARPRQVPRWREEVRRQLLYLLTQLGGPKAESLSSMVPQGVGVEITSRTCDINHWEWLSRFLFA